MKKLILAVAMAIVAVLNVQSATHAKVQLWEGGPYWATTNIGADNPWDYGLYFWWGDTTGYKLANGVFDFSFDTSHTPTHNKNSAILQSEGWIVGGVLALAHDAAHVKWGGGWRMPTYKELLDLCYTYCDWTWTTMNGVNGYVVRGRGTYSSNSIFLPAAGIGDGNSRTGVDSIGFYRSSVSYSDNGSAYVLLFDSSGANNIHSTSNYSRFFGMPIRPVQGFGEEADCVIQFNANGGTGTMESQTFEDGKAQKLSKNTYHKDGYLFQGWAKSTEHAANGIVDYTDEQEIMVDSDMALYAVWANPPLTLTAESADWSSGSITLKCEDPDTSGESHRYSLEYKNESGVWEEVDDAKNKLATKGQNANGQEAWVVKLTDATFWSRLGGIPPVEYRVKDENGRVSEPCVTRNRFLLSVGYSDYSFAAKKKYKIFGKAAYLLEAATFRLYCIEHGGVASQSAHLIYNETAKAGDLTAEMSYFAAQTSPGDVFLFYISTHGGDYSLGDNGTMTYAALATYDLPYKVHQLLEDIRNFSASVAIVCTIDACHSFSLTGSVDARKQSVVQNRINDWLVKSGFSQCLGNVAWVTSCDAHESSYTYPAESNSRFGRIFIVNGLQNGCADMELFGTEYEGVAPDGRITFGELYRYSHEFYKGLSDYLPSEVKSENGPLLDRVVVGTRSTVPDWGKPSPPIAVMATQGTQMSKVTIQWMPSDSAQDYWIYRYVQGCPSAKAWIGVAINGATSFSDEIGNGFNMPEVDLDTHYEYCIKAVNPLGMSEFSISDIGFRGTVEYLSFLDKYKVSANISAEGYAAIEKMMSANGCRTVGECYALGIDPEDPDDDFKVTHFEMKDGKPVITLNHTEDGSGNSFLPRVKTLGKSNLSDAEWREVPEEGDDTMRFFKVEVEMP